MQARADNAQSSMQEKMRAAAKLPRGSKERKALVREAAQLSMLRDKLLASAKKGVALPDDAGELEAEIALEKAELCAVSAFAKAEVAKVSEEHGLVFGFAIVCKVDGEPYYDKQDDHIPEASMLAAATDFMLHSRVAKEMHRGEQCGDVVFAFPLTEDIAKALEITTKYTGLMIAIKPSSPDMLEKFRSGELRGFSIGGQRVVDEDA